MTHTRTHAHDGSNDRQRKQSGVAAHLHRECSAGNSPDTVKCVPLGTCLIGGGERTHSLRKQAHMAIITLISGGLGEMVEGGVGGTGLKRNMRMEKQDGGGVQWFSWTEAVDAELGTHPWKQVSIKVPQGSGKNAEGPLLSICLSQSKSDQGG